MSMADADARSGRNNLEIADTLLALIGTLEQVSIAGAVAADAAEAAVSSLTQARRESLMPLPSKWTLLDHLEDAATALSAEPGAEAIRASITETYEVAKASL
ncbi:MAG: hypothetical protein K0Q72_4861 [Armatimonadetes bacterium]|jgi:hypothetical protein|nr:hypothetical protein [Armatimonadota bacterium]